MSENAKRKEWMGVLAKSPASALEALLQGREPQGWRHLRVPEVGSVMVRGRAGGEGAQFNLGEMTVTRCSVQLSGGVVGHGYVQGRDKMHAQRAALVDALMQTDQAPVIAAEVLAPLRGQLSDRAEQRAAKAAATKVEFFTMVRGED